MTDLPPDQVQQTVANRLAKLRSFPVDTSRLDRTLRAQIPPVPHHPKRWWVSLATVAASLLLIATILFILQPRPVQASPNLMAQMHYDIVSGKIHTMKVNSIDQANDAIAAMAQDAPRLPSAPAEHTMACCMRDIGHKKVACVLLENDGIPVTMSVANAADVAPQKGSSVETFHGVDYHVQTIGSLHMVMLNHQDKWICLISQAPAHSLMALADRLKR